MPKGLRHEAKQNGVSKYFTGNACSRGHISERWTNNGTCVVCSLEINRRNPQWSRNRNKDPGYRAKKSASAKRRRKDPLIRASRRACRMKENADRGLRTPSWTDFSKVKAFYRLAVAFSDLYVPHHVDHVIPLNGKNVCGLHVENNLRVITAEDNMNKGNRIIGGL